MKKIIVTLLTLVLIGWGYLIYRKKTGYNHDGSEMSDYTERIRMEREIDVLKEKITILKELNDSLIALKTNSLKTNSQPEKSDEKVTELNREIGALRVENDDLRRELDSRKSAPKQTASTTKTKKKNEKTLPIARNTRAIELQRYLTELYGDR
jgi:regulator of replication initiation timing